jgi:hypothetical protein
MRVTVTTSPGASCLSIFEKFAPVVVRARHLFAVNLSTSCGAKSGSGSALVYLIGQLTTKGLCLPFSRNSVINPVVSTRYLGSDNPLFFVVPTMIVHALDIDRPD